MRKSTVCDGRVLDLSIRVILLPKLVTGHVLQNVQETNKKSDRRLHTNPSSDNLAQSTAKGLKGSS